MESNKKFQQETLAKQSIQSDEERMKRETDNYKTYRQQELAKEYGTDKGQHARTKKKNTYVVPAMDEDKLLESEQMTGNHLRRNVRLGVMDVLGTQVYNNFEEIVKGNKEKRTLTLAHGKTRRLAESGERVIEINFGGTTMDGFFNVSKGQDSVSENSTEIIKNQSKQKNRTINVEGRTIKDTMTEDEFKDATLGKKVEGMNGIRLKEATYGEGNVVKKYNIAGPGVFNKVGHTTEEIIDEAFKAGTQTLDAYYKEWVDHHDASGYGNKPINLIMQGFSRGAASVTPAAMALKAYANEHYNPDFVKLIHFELVKYDPVPGNAFSDDQEEVDLRKDATKPVNYTSSKYKMAPLGDSVNSTLFYCINPEYTGIVGRYFEPQRSRGEDRIILLPSKHSAGTAFADSSQRNTENGVDTSERAHSMTYIDAKTGMAYRGSSINELPRGVYICDENNVLVRLNNAEEANKLLNNVINGSEEKHEADSKAERNRRRSIDKSLEYWFADNGSVPTEVNKAERDTSRGFVTLDKEDEEYKKLTNRIADLRIWDINTQVSAEVAKRSNRFIYPIDGALKSEREAATSFKQGLNDEIERYRSTLVDQTGDQGSDEYLAVISALSNFTDMTNALFSQEMLRDINQIRIGDSRNLEKAYNRLHKAVSNYCSSHKVYKGKGIKGNGKIRRQTCENLLENLDSGMLKGYLCHVLPAMQDLEDEKTKEAEYELHKNDKKEEVKDNTDHQAEYRKLGQNRTRIDEKRWSISNEDLKEADERHDLFQGFNSKWDRNARDNMKSNITDALDEIAQRTGVPVPAEVKAYVDGFRALSIKIRKLESEKEGIWELWNTDGRNPAISVAEKSDAMRKALKTYRKQLDADGKDYVDAILRELDHGIFHSWNCQMFTLCQEIDDAMLEKGSDKEQQMADEIDEVINRYDKGGDFLEVPSQEEIARIHKEGTIAERLGMYILIEMLLEVEEFHNTVHSDKKVPSVYEDLFSKYKNDFIESLGPISEIHAARYMTAYQNVHRIQFADMAEGMLEGEDPETITEEKRKQIMGRMRYTFEGMKYEAIIYAVGDTHNLCKTFTALNPFYMEEGVLTEHKKIVKYFETSGEKAIKNLNRMSKEDKELYYRNIDDQLEKEMRYISQRGLFEGAVVTGFTDIVDDETDEVIQEHVEYERTHHVLNWDEPVSEEVLSEREQEYQAYRERNKARKKADLTKWQNEALYVDSMLNEEGKIEFADSRDWYNAHRETFANTVENLKNGVGDPENNAQLLQKGQTFRDNAIRLVKLASGRIYNQGAGVEDENKFKPQDVNLPYETQRAYDDFKAELKAARKHASPEAKTAIDNCLRELDTSVRNSLICLLDMGERTVGVLSGCGDEASVKIGQDVDKCLNTYIDKNGMLKLPSPEESEKILKGDDPNAIAALIFAYDMADAMQAKMFALGLKSENQLASNPIDVANKMINKLADTRGARFNMRVQEAIVHAGFYYHTKYQEEYNKRIAEAKSHGPMTREDHAKLILSMSTSIAGLKAIARANAIAGWGTAFPLIEAVMESERLGRDKFLDRADKLYLNEQDTKTQEILPLFSEKTNKEYLTPLKKKLREMFDNIYSELSEDFVIVNKNERIVTEKKSGDDEEGDGEENPAQEQTVQVKKVEMEVVRDAVSSEEKDRYKKEGTQYDGYADLKRQRADLKNWTKRPKYGLDGVYSKEDKEVEYLSVIQFPSITKYHDLYRDAGVRGIVDEMEDLRIQLMLYLNADKGLEKKRLDDVRRDEKNAATLHLRLMDAYDRLIGVLKAKNTAASAPTEEHPELPTYKKGAFSKLIKVLENDYKPYLGGLLNMAEMYNNVAYSSGDEHAISQAKSVDVLVNKYFGDNGVLRFNDILAVKKKYEEGKVDDPAEVAALVYALSMAQEIRNQSVALGVDDNLEDEESENHLIGQIIDAYLVNHDDEAEAKLAEILCHTYNFYSDAYVDAYRKNLTEGENASAKAKVKTAISLEGIKGAGAARVLSLMKGGHITGMYFSDAIEKAEELGYKPEYAALKSELFDEDGLDITGLDELADDREFEYYRQILELHNASIVMTLKKPQIQYEAEMSPNKELYANIMNFDFTEGTKSKEDEKDAKPEKKQEEVKQEEKQEAKEESKADDSQEIEEILNKLDKRLKTMQEIDHRNQIEKQLEEVAKSKGEDVQKLKEQRAREEELKKLEEQKAKEEELKKLEEQKAREEELRKLEEQKAKEEELKKQKEQQAQEELKKQQEKKVEPVVLDYGKLYDKWDDSKTKIGGSLADVRKGIAEISRGMALNLDEYAKLNYTFQKVELYAARIQREISYIGSAMLDKKEKSEKIRDYHNMMSTIKEEYGKLSSLLSNLAAGNATAEEALFAEWAQKMLNGEGNKPGIIAAGKECLDKMEKAANDAMDLSQAQKAKEDEQGFLSGLNRDILGKDYEKELSELVRYLKWKGMDTSHVRLEDIVGGDIPLIKSKQEEIPEYSQKPGNVQFKNLHVRERQVGSTCWAFASSLMLRAQGVDVSPYNIAGYIPTSVNSIRSAAHNYYEATNTTYSPAERQEVFSKLLDHNKCSLRHSEYWNLHDSQNKGNIAKLEDEIRLALDQHSTVALTVAGHFVSIVGYKGSMFMFEDSIAKPEEIAEHNREDTCETRTLEEFMQAHDYHLISKGRQRGGLAIDWIRRKDINSEEISKKADEIIERNDDRNFSADEIELK